METAHATAGELLARLDDGSLTSVAIVERCLARITAENERIGAFLSVDGENALAQAAEIDRRRAAGEPLGPLAGLPVAIKDNLCARGNLTTCASRMLANFRPPYDAHVIERLKSADAVLLGRTNMDEFAMGSSNENSAFQLTRNPWNLEHSPGGSSGGSAAAVAAGMVPLAVGSDTGGSIRQPAAFCGVVGMKPTYGRVSRYGLIAFASSLDQIGPFANDVAGAALLLETLAGHDPRDATCVDRPPPECANRLDEPLSGLKIGVVEEHFSAGLNGEVREAVEDALDVYRDLGADVIDIHLPHSKYGVAAYYLVAPSEASSNLARYDGVHYGHRAADYENLLDMYSRTRGEGFGPEVKRRVMLGTYALSAGYYDAYYLKALKVRRLIHDDYAAAFERVDVIAAPVTPTPPFRIGELIDDPLAMYLSDIYTLGANLAGIPGVSVPAGFSRERLPIGLQLLGPAFSEERLLRAARMFERATDWHRQRPGDESPTAGAN